MNKCLMHDIGVEGFSATPSAKAAMLSMHRVLIHFSDIFLGSTEPESPSFVTYLNIRTYI